MGSRIPSCFHPSFLTFAFIVSVLLFSPAPSWSATPIVDDTTFIVNAGTYKAPIGDLDLLILRERVSATPVNLTPYDNPDPSGIVVTGNPLTFGSPDCIQSILVRLFDGSPAGVFRTSSGTISFADGPSTNVRILGVITDIVSGAPDLNGSDLVFQTSTVAAILGSAPGRRLETVLPGLDSVAISNDRKSATFSMSTSNGADDVRVIVDYGDGVCPVTPSIPSGDFPAGVTFSVNLIDNIATTKGVRVGETEFGEAIMVTGIPLTSSSAPDAQSPTRLPDVNYFGHTRARDINRNFGGEDDHIGIYYVAVDPAIGGNPGPDFYIWVLDGDNDSSSASTVGTDDRRTGTSTTPSVFEYMLYGGPGGNAGANDDLIGPTGGDPIDFGNNGDPTDDFSGTLIDINPNRSADLPGLFNSAQTLLTNADTGPLPSHLRDQDWTVIGVDIDVTPGYVIPSNPVPGSIDESLNLFYGAGKYIYKLVVDGRDVRAQVAAGLATDFSRYQIDSSTSSTDPNVGDCRGIKPISNCVVPFAYELVFAGRPLSQIPIVTETFILVPPLQQHQLDIQTLDLDEAGGGVFNDIPGTSARVTRSADRPNQPSGTAACPFPSDNTSPDSCTLESGNQLGSATASDYLWSSLNQTERSTGSAFPTVKDGATCGPGPFGSTLSLCYDTLNHEDVLWKVAIDPVDPLNPYALRAFIDSLAAALIPVAPTPPDVTPPTPPTLAASPVTSTQIDLSWSGATDSVGIGSYRIYRVDPIDGTTVLGLLTTVSGSVFSYVDAGRTPSTTYCYQVTAVDLSSNQSDPSNVACATTPSGDTTGPSAPVLTATPVSQTQIDASWTAATDNVGGTGVAGYELYSCQAPNTTTDCTASGGTLLIDTMNPTVLNYPNTGLTAGTRYCYAVRAYDGVNNLGPFSNNACANTPDPPQPPDTTPPSAPALSATPFDSTQIDLSWTAATDDVAVTEYLLFRCQATSDPPGCTPSTAAGTQIATLTASTLSYDDMGLAPSTPYCYVVVAKDAAGNPTSSNTDCATTAPPPPAAPSAPSLSATAAGPTEIDLSWGASNPNGGTITSYQIYLCSPGPCTPSTSGVPLATVSGTTLMYPNTGLTPNTSYCYLVTATDSEALTSPPSNVVCATTPADATAPSIPDELEATAMSSSQINVSWDGSMDNVGVVEYRLYRRIGTSGPLTFLTSVMTTIYSNTGLTASTTYCYYVTAVDAAGNESNPSNIDCATTFGVGGFEPATIMITPVTINLGTSGIPINVFISFDQTVPGAHVAQDICITGVNTPPGCPTDTTVYKIRMHFPPLSNNTIPTPIDHMSGTEIFTGNNSLNVKFRRADVEARLEPADDVILEVRGLLKDTHTFSGTDTVNVNP